LNENNNILTMDKILQVLNIYLYNIFQFVI
jgi:hypothetical protein